MHLFFNNAKRSLTTKIVITIGALILFSHFLFCYLTIQNAKRNFISDAITFSASLSKTAKKNLRNEMLAVNRNSTQRILETINLSSSADSLQVLDIDGMVRYSADKEEVGTEIKDALLFQFLSKQSIADYKKSIKKPWFIRENINGQGHRMLSYIEPIINEVDCFTATCHVHDKNQEILGFLKTDLSLQSIDSRLKKMTITASIYLIVSLSIITLVLGLVLQYFVIKPISNLSESMRSVSKGDLFHKIISSSKDEIGGLAHAFNEMTDELGSVRQKLESRNQVLIEKIAQKNNQIKRAQDKSIQGEKLAALGRLTTDIAHEIRNSLTVLEGFCRRLQNSVLTDKQKEYAHVIVSETGRLEKTLRDVLKFSRESKLNLQKIPVSETVIEALLFFDDMFKEHSITAKLVIDTDLPVLIDAVHIRQAINNLLLNAIDAMPGGGILTVSVKSELLADITYIGVHISDTGPGIPEEKLDLIFEPFYTEKIEQGTGLGLPISRKIIEEHGGFIKAVNEAEGGFSISLYFPHQSEQEMSQTPCWEHMKCRRDTNQETKCPAYPYFGRICWAVAGTLCAGEIQGTFAQKLTDCKRCGFYKSIRTQKSKKNN